MNPPPPPYERLSRVGPAGGRFFLETSQGRGVEATIPPGAVRTELALTAIETSARHGALAPVFDVGEPTHFSSGVTLRLRLRQEDVPWLLGNTKLAVNTYDPDAGQWVPLDPAEAESGAPEDAAGDEVERPPPEYLVFSGTTSHFSLFTVAPLAAGETYYAGEQTGTSFEVGPVGLESSEPIVLSSATVMDTRVDFLIRGLGAQNAELAISGLRPGAQLIVLDNGYHQQQVIFTDASGRASFTQALGNDPHAVLILAEGGTYIIDATAPDPTDPTQLGGDCNQIGEWIAASLTCRLTGDVEDSVEVVSADTTLDGAGYQIRKLGAGFPVSVAAPGVTVTGCSIEHILDGLVVLPAAQGATVTGNDFLGHDDLMASVELLGGGPEVMVSDNDFDSGTGVEVRDAAGSTVSGNRVVATRNFWLRETGSTGNVVTDNEAQTVVRGSSSGLGVGLSRGAGNNLVEGNTFVGPGSGSCVVHNDGAVANEIRGNTISGFTRGFTFYNEGGAVVDRNQVSGAGPVLYFGGTASAATRVFLNDFTGNTAGITGGIAIELSDAGRGNFWGHHCVAGPPYFDLSTDTNNPQARDSYPYGVPVATLDPASVPAPPGCEVTPVDDDGDGHASIAAGGDDCDDGDHLTFPGAAEICDGLDNDCDGEPDEGVCGSADFEPVAPTEPIPATHYWIFGPVQAEPGGSTFEVTVPSSAVEPHYYVIAGDNERVGPLRMEVDGEEVLSTDQINPNSQAMIAPATVGSHTVSLTDASGQGFGDHAPPFLEVVDELYVCAICDDTLTRQSGPPATTTMPLRERSTDAVPRMVIEKDLDYPGMHITAALSPSGEPLVASNNLAGTRQAMVVELALGDDEAISVTTRGQPGGSIRMRVDDLDAHAPAGTILQPVRGDVTHSPWVTFSGITDDPTSEVTFYGGVTGGTSTSVSPDGTFSAQVELEPGMSTTVVCVTDPCGNSSCGSVDVLLTEDFTPPVVEILNPASGSLHAGTIPVMLDIAVEDRGGSVPGEAIEVTLNGEEYPLIRPATAPGRLTTMVELAPGSYELVASATDAAGNRGSASVDFEVIDADLTKLGGALSDLFTSKQADDLAVALASGDAKEVAKAGEPSLVYAWEQSVLVDVYVDMVDEASASIDYLRPLAAKSVRCGHLPRICNVDIGLPALAALSSDPKVTRLTPLEAPLPILNLSVPKIGADLYHDASPPLTGAGRVIGVIENVGPDIFHPDLRREDGSTIFRSILCHRSQTNPEDLCDPSNPIPLCPPRDESGESPNEFSNTIELDRTFINNVLAGESGYDYPWEECGGIITEDNHGTPVTAIAAGTGLSAAGYPGVAPDADVIYVAGGDTVMALDYIYGLARLAGPDPALRPALPDDFPIPVNRSLGVVWGCSHAGISRAQMEIDEVLSAGPNRVMVNAAGNSRKERQHASGDVTDPDQNECEEEHCYGFSLEWDETYAGQNLYMNLYTFPEVRFEVTVYDQRLIDDENPGGEWVAPADEEFQYFPGGSFVLNVVRSHTQDYGIDVHDKDNHINIRITSIGDTGVTISFRAHLDASQISVNSEIGIWDAYATPSDAHFTGEYVTGYGTLVCESHARGVIAVGAYCIREVSVYDKVGDIAHYSSWGPSRYPAFTGPKPDIAAPGQSIWAASGGGGADLFGGTSMAAPHVTGAIALLYQQFGDLSIDEIRSLLAMRARVDDYVLGNEIVIPPSPPFAGYTYTPIDGGPVPNTGFGYGKLSLECAGGGLLCGGMYWQDSRLDGFVAGADLIAGSATIPPDVEMLDLRVDLYGSPYESGYDLELTWCVDTDWNPTTGGKCQGANGADLSVRLFYPASAQSTEDLELDIALASGEVLAVSPCDFDTYNPDTHTVSIVIPMALLGLDFPIVRYYVEMTVSATTDYAPNVPDFETGVLGYYLTRYDYLAPLEGIQCE